MTLRILPYGPTAALVECDDLDEVLRVATALEEWAEPAVVDLVPAARTVLVIHDGSLDHERLRGRASSAGERTGRARAAVEVVIEVDYSGPDLHDVADTAGLSVEEVVRRHTRPLYTCAFCGFMPGFSYLVGLDPVLERPRRSTPRTRVAAGSVAIAAGFSAVYPTASPGGWHLLGTTESVMWDPSLPSPALIPPGATVRFVSR